MFAVGIIGTGLLAQCCTRRVGGICSDRDAIFQGSLDAKLVKARLFYATIAITTLAGASLNAVGIDPARALYWAAVVNGIPRRDR